MQWVAWYMQYSVNEAVQCIPEVGPIAHDHPLMISCSLT